MEILAKKLNTKSCFYKSLSFVVNFFLISENIRISKKAYNFFENISMPLSDYRKNIINQTKEKIENNVIIDRKIIIKYNKFIYILLRHLKKMKFLGKKETSPEIKLSIDNIIKSVSMILHGKDCLLCYIIFNDDKNCRK